VSTEVSYYVYVKQGVDSIGRDDYGEAVTHFVERNNAVALKRRLVARGEMVRVERSVVHGLSEKETERWYSDYHRVPEYELSGESASSQEVPQEPSGDLKSAVEEPERAEEPCPYSPECAEWTVLGRYLTR
jgi:hypothetical protein